MRTGQKREKPPLERPAYRADQRPTKLPARRLRKEGRTRCLRSGPSIYKTGPSNETEERRGKSDDVTQRETGEKKRERRKPQVRGEAVEFCPLPPSAHIPKDIRLNHKQHFVLAEFYTLPRLSRTLFSRFLLYTTYVERSCGDK